MIVVVIIGLLAAMAIPAFKKVRETSIAKTVINDARQLGGAAQQYFMENGASTVACTISAGVIGGPLSVYVTKISAATTMSQTDLTTVAEIVLANPNLKGVAGGPAGDDTDGVITFTADGVMKQ